MDRNERDFFKGYSKLDERVRILERSRAAVTGTGGGVTDHGALTGLGDDDHTQYHNNARGDARYYQKSEVDTALSVKSDTSHNHDSRYYTETESDALLGAKISTSQKGVAGGVAELDGSGLVPSAQLPSFVDDVLEYANFAALPGTGTTGKIYVTLDDNKTYRWSGSAYTEISASLALGSTSSTAHRGDHGSTAYTHSQDVSTNPHNVTKGQVGLGNVDNTSDVDKPVSTAQQTALDGKQPLDSDLTAIAGISPSNDDIIQRKAGSWINRTMAQLKADLALVKADVGLSNVPNVDATNRANHTGTQLASTISDIDEYVEDKIGAKVIAGTGISISYNDTTGETTVTYTGGGGGGLTASQIVDLVYPIGTIYGNGTYTTNPATLIGYGTWAAYAEGRAIVGQDTGQTEFDTIGETGGSKTHTLTTAEMPSHTHIQDAHTHIQNAHNHAVTDPGHSLTQLAKSSAGSGNGIATASNGGASGVWGSQSTQFTGISIQNATPTNQNTTATNQNTGGGGAHNNLQPYIVAKWWIRTA